MKTKLINEQKIDRLTQLWKDHGEALSLADYYENEGSRKGDSPEPYYKKTKDIEKRAAKEFGTVAAWVMKDHSDAMANVWYGQRDKSGYTKGKALRAQHNINWDGTL